MANNLNMETVKSEIRNLVAEIVEIPPGEIKEDADFAKDLGVDSMMALEIVASIEKKYKVVILEEEIPTIRSLGNVYELMAKRLKK